MAKVAAKTTLGEVSSDMPIVHGDRLSDAFTDEQKCFKKFRVKKLPRLRLLESVVNVLADKFLDVEVLFSVTVNVNL